MKQSLRLGLIGAGRWGRNYIKTIAALDDVRLVRLASRNPESARLVESDCIISNDWRELIDSGDLDGVIIATPPALHAEMTRSAVRAGLPVLVEKPLTLDLDEAISLRDFVAAAGGLVMVGHTHLFHPAFRALKKLAGNYGEILEIHSVAGNCGPFRSDTPVLWDWGAHDVAMCLDLIDSIPVATKAVFIENRITPEGTGQIVELQLEFHKKISAVIRVGNILPRQRRFAVHFESAVMVYDDLAEHKLVIYPVIANKDADAWTKGAPVATEPDLPLTCEVREFAKAITSERRDFASLDLGVQVARTLQQAESELRGSSAGN